MLSFVKNRNDYTHIKLPMPSTEGQVLSDLSCKNTKKCQPNLTETEWTAFVKEIRVTPKSTI